MLMMRAMMRFVLLELIRIGPDRGELFGNEEGIIAIRNSLVACRHPYEVGDDPVKGRMDLHTRHGGLVELINNNRAKHFSDPRLAEHGITGDLFDVFVGRENEYLSRV